MILVKGYEVEGCGRHVGARRHAGLFSRRGHGRVEARQEADRVAHAVPKKKVDEVGHGGRRLGMLPVGAAAAKMGDSSETAGEW